MNERLFFNPCRRVLLIFSMTLAFMNVLTTQAQTDPPSKETTVIDGKTYITHPINAKDTYYLLSRIYEVPVKEIIEANNKKSLRVGDFVHIPVEDNPIAVEEKPSEERPREVTNTRPVGSTTKETITGKVLTEYKVGTRETLFSIARRFGSTVEDVKKFNDLESDALKAGQILKIPDGPVRVVTTSTAPSAINIPLPDNITREEIEIEFKTNRYGIREKKEKGIGIWMDNLETRGKSNLALHRTAPVGTILKITNPLTKNVTFAKVVGKFSDTAESRDAIVILSKSAASYIGALDKRFLIEITYGAPVN